MKNLKLLMLFSLAIVTANAAVTLTGTSLRNTIGLTSGDFGAYVVSIDGTAISSSNFSFSIGADLNDSATYGASFALVGTNTASSFLGTTSLASGHSINLIGGIDSNDVFGIITFDNSTSTALVGDTFRVWTAFDWVLPTDGSTQTFNNEMTQLDSVAASSTGTVVPEPSSFALLAGCFGLAWVMVRRRS